MPSPRPTYLASLVRLKRPPLAPHSPRPLARARLDRFANKAASAAAVASDTVADTLRAADADADAVIALCHGDAATAAVDGFAERDSSMTSMTEQNLDLDLDDLTLLRDDPEEPPHAMLEWAWTGSGVATGRSGAPPIAADRSGGPAQRGRRAPQRRESRGGMATRTAMASRAPFLATEAGSSDDACHTRSVSLHN